jgi:hypothetical protein
VLNINIRQVITRQSASLAATVLSRSLMIKPCNSCLLRAPLHAGQVLANALKNKSEVLQRAVDRLRLVPAHDALALLRLSFSAQRLMYILRCSQCHGHPALTAFDGLLCLITNYFPTFNGHKPVYRFVIVV